MPNKKVLGQREFRRYAIKQVVYKMIDEMGFVTTQHLTTRTGISPRAISTILDWNSGEWGLEPGWAYADQKNNGAPPLKQAVP